MRASYPGPLPNPLALLLKPRATLRVLEHIAEHPSQRPREAYAQLGIANNTWYAAVRNLERLNLVAPTRGPAHRKVKAFHITPQGERALASVRELAAQVADSRGALEWELLGTPPLKGSARAGEVVCRLIEYAERRADFAELGRLESVAKKLGRPGEAHHARQVASFLVGQPKAAADAGEAAMEALGREGNTRSLRRVLTLQGGAYEYLGDVQRSNRMNLEARVKAHKAGDHAAELEAWMSLGITQARIGMHADAIRHMNRALGIAEREGLAVKRAKVLGNISFAEGLLDERKGLERADEALKAARRLGAQILIARAQLNRALFLAVLARPQEAHAAMREAKHLLAEGGEEKGDEMLLGWDRLVRQISRRRPSPYRGDWRAQALQLARSRPPQTSAKPRG